MKNKLRNAVIILLHPPGLILWFAWLSPLLLSHNQTITMSKQILLGSELSFTALGAYLGMLFLIDLGLVYEKFFMKDKKEEGTKVVKS